MLMGRIFVGFLRDGGLAKYKGLAALPDIYQLAFLLRRAWRRSRAFAVGRVLIIVGFKTRLAALALAIFVVIAALLAHTNFADQNQLNHFLKNVAIAGGCLAFFVSGAGLYSVDARRP